MGSDGRLSVDTLDELPSLAPITDFCVFDYDKQGRVCSLSKVQPFATSIDNRCCMQHTMICCSNNNLDGSLRILQGGLGFVEQFAVPVVGIKNLWSIKASSNHW